MKDFLFCLGLVILLLVGCSIFDRRKDDDPGWVTPSGHEISSLEGGQAFEEGYLTRERVSSDIDAQVSEWAKARAGTSGKSEADLLYLARRRKYALHDDYRIWVGSMSPTGYASGYIKRDVVGNLSGEIHLAIWRRGGPVRERAIVPEGAPPWTVRQIAEGGWTWGHSDGLLVPAVGHELDHLIGIDHD